MPSGLRKTYTLEYPVAGTADAAQRALGELPARETARRRARAGDGEGVAEAGLTNGL